MGSIFSIIKQYSNTIKRQYSDRCTLDEVVIIDVNLDITVLNKLVCSYLDSEAYFSDNRFDINIIKVLMLEHMFTTWLDNISILDATIYDLNLIPYVTDILWGEFTGHTREYIEPTEEQFNGLVNLIHNCLASDAIKEITKVIYNCIKNNNLDVNKIVCILLDKEFSSEYSDRALARVKVVVYD